MNDKDARDMADLAFGGSSAVSGDASKLPPMPDLRFHPEFRRGFAAALSDVQKMRAASQASLAKRGTEPSDEPGEQLSARASDAIFHWRERALKAEAALAESAPSEKLSGAEPTLYVSPEQLAGIKQPEGEHGAYLPIRKSPAGKFTQPLYASHAETVPHVPAGQMYREKCPDNSRCLHGCHSNEPCLQRASMQAEAPHATEDARRYRWLRTNMEYADFVDGGYVNTCLMSKDEREKENDAAVDAVRKSQGEAP